MIISSRQNKIVKSFKNPPADSFAVEGEKLIAEALDAGLRLQHLLIAQGRETRLSVSGTVITPELSEYVSEVKSPQGVFALFERRTQSFDFTAAHRLILLDGVRDPGNVGAIARSCEAFGMDGAVLSEDSADVYNAKVVRASAGSVFRLPCVYHDLCEVITALKQSGFAVYASVLDEGAIALKTLERDAPERLAVIIGNEGQGVSAQVAALCDEKLYIPIKGAESLNAGVAAGIICYAISEM
ncbi:MAG: RNA methyltransferase [Oscillospiraceae bacterium]|nr:RNA methyltransferase [Oscillospiraceae bacterium]